MTVNESRRVAPVSCATVSLYHYAPLPLFVDVCLWALDLPTSRLGGRASLADPLQRVPSCGGLGGIVSFPSVSNLPYKIHISFIHIMSRIVV